MRSLVTGLALFGLNSQLQGSLLPILLAKLSFSPLERDEFLFRRLKKAVARCYCQLSVFRHSFARRLVPSYSYPTVGTEDRFGVAKLRNYDI